VFTSYLGVHVVWLQPYTTNVWLFIDHCCEAERGHLAQTGVSDIKKEHFDTGHVELLGSVARQLGK
jgi:hypothetical protein